MKEGEQKSRRGGGILGGCGWGGWVSGRKGKGVGSGGASWMLGLQSVSFGRVGEV